MARLWFGGGVADWVIRRGAGSLAVLAAATAVTFWDSPTGGTRYEDLLDADGDPVVAVLSGDGSSAPYGFIPRFQGPDNTPALWADAGGGHRFLMFADPPALASVVLSADATNATETFADVGGLVFTLPVGTWAFEFIASYTGSVTGAGGTTLNARLTGTATFSQLLYFIELQSSNSTTASYTRTALEVTAPASASVVAGTSTAYFFKIRGRATVTIAGTLKPQFALFPAATGTLAVKAGSYATLRAA
jgi:hypothetical protein